MNVIKIFPAGDSALVAEFGNQIDPDINDQVHALALQLKKQHIPGILEMVPTFRSLLIHYDPLVLNYCTLETEITKLQTTLASDSSAAGRILEIH